MDLKLKERTSNSTTHSLAASRSSLKVFSRSLCKFNYKHIIITFLILINNKKIDSFECCLLVWKVHPWILLHKREQMTSTLLEDLLHSCCYNLKENLVNFGLNNIESKCECESKSSTCHLQMRKIVFPALWKLLLPLPVSIIPLKVVLELLPEMNACNKDNRPPITITPSNQIGYFRSTSYRQRMQNLEFGESDKQLLSLQ